MSATGKRASSDRITTNAVLFGHLLSGVRRSSSDFDQLLRDCGIDPLQIKKPAYRIPVSAAVSLLHRSRYLLQDELLGLLPDPLPLGYFRHSVLSIIHQKTLGQALHRYIEFSNVFIASLNFQLEQSGRMVEVTISRNPDQKILDNVAIDTAMATFHRLAGWLCNELLFLERVTLDYAPPSYHREYQHLFYGAPVQFHHDLNSLVFEARYLDLPIVQNESSAESYVRRAPLDIYLPQDVRGETSRRIREQLKTSIVRAGSIDEMQAIASGMGVSSQTIRRRLAREGTSFNAIKSQVRRDLSMNTLGNLDLSIEEVAIKMGYSEPAAFIRAFKSWTGLSPARFRKLVNAQP